MSRINLSRTALTAAATCVAATLLSAGIALTTAKAQSDPGANAAQGIKAQEFMLLPYETKKAVAARTDEARSKAYWASWADYTDKLKGAGVLAGGSALQEPNLARTVRVENGKERSEAGPYANSPEQLTGYLTIRVRSMEEAVRWAAQSPAATAGGAVEVRPTVPTMASSAR